MRRVMVGSEREVMGRESRRAFIYRSPSSSRSRAIRVDRRVCVASSDLVR